MTQYDTRICKGSTVFCKEHEDFNKLMRRFKKKVNESGLLQELRNREHYVKPTTERKHKKAQAAARHKKSLAAQTLPKTPF